MDGPKGRSRVHGGLGLSVSTSRSTLLKASARASFQQIAGSPGTDGGPRRHVGGRNTFCCRSRVMFGPNVGTFLTAFFIVAALLAGFVFDMCVGRVGRGWRRG